MKIDLKKEISESIEVKKNLISQTSLIEEIGHDLSNCFKNKGKIILCGNGGSAADSQHISAELVGKFSIDRTPLPALALTTNTSILTAISNDYSFDEVFSRQISAICHENDIVIGISTSGNSTNVIKAVEEANKIGAITVALTGGNGGILSAKSKKSIIVKSKNTQRIQECHILIGHLLCLIVESDLF